MQSIISIANLSKTYASGQTALKNASLDSKSGEILAPGPDGAGKTTLSSIIYGLVNASTGAVMADGHDTVKDFRATRSLIGLVPQELTPGAFDTMWNTLQMQFLPAIRRRSANRCRAVFAPCGTAH